MSRLINGSRANGIVFFGYPMCDGLTGLSVANAVTGAPVGWKAADCFNADGVDTSIQLQLGQTCTEPGLICGFGFTLQRWRSEAGRPQFPFVLLPSI